MSSYVLIGLNRLLLSGQEHGDILESLDVYFADRFRAERLDGSPDTSSLHLCH